jgi:glycosyltransferase involved in cell wall biosynthesis
MTTKIPGVAGPAAFQRRLADGLVHRGWKVSYGFSNLPCGIILVIGGSREFGQLRVARDEGIPIVQRLNGMNWIHRQTSTGLRHYIRAEFNNFILRIIRDRFASWIIYQSDFAQRWWEDKYGVKPVGNSIIHNGVPINTYSPKVEGEDSEDRIRLLMVEGNLSGGYEVGLRTGVRLAREINQRTDKQVLLRVVGNVPDKLKHEFTGLSEIEIDWVGLLPPDQVPGYFRSADLLYAGDPNPACPNAVIEALASGLPVVAFNTGAIPEIVLGESGRIVPYGGDVWELDPPDVAGLAGAVVGMLDNLPLYKKGARKRALEAFDVDMMVDRYISVFDQVME